MWCSVGRCVCWTDAVEDRKYYLKLLNHHLLCSVLVSSPPLLFPPCFLLSSELLCLLCSSHSLPQMMKMLKRPRDSLPLIKWKHVWWIEVMTVKCEASANIPTWPGNEHQPAATFSCRWSATNVLLLQENMIWAPSWEPGHDHIKAHYGCVVLLSSHHLHINGHYILFSINI